MRSSVIWLFSSVLCACVALWTVQGQSVDVDDPEPSDVSPPGNSSELANPSPSTLAPRWKKCFALTGVKRRLAALPGTGWDNLMSKDMGVIFELTYDKCKVTEDGKFLIPDQVHAIPLQKSEVRSLIG